MPYFTTGNSENEQTAPLKEENGYATISLPDAGYGFSHLPYGYLNSQRKENLLIPRPVNEVYTYTIECPENMELRTPETDKTIRNAAGSLTISVKKNGRTATVTRSLELNKQLYTPAEYKDLRHAFDRMERCKRKDSIVFSTIKTITFRMADTACYINAVSAIPKSLDLLVRGFKMYLPRT